VKNNKRTKYLDVIIFFITGLTGLILAYLWLFSSHKTAPNNFNILWALVPNLIVAFFMLKATAKKWLQKYILALLICLGIIPLLWFLEIQVFPIAIIPVLILLFVRYLFLYKYLLSSKK
jgi:hypothetical protein